MRTNPPPSCPRCSPSSTTTTRVSSSVSYSCAGSQTTFASSWSVPARQIYGSSPSRRTSSSKHRVSASARSGSSHRALPRATSKSTEGGPSRCSNPAHCSYHNRFGNDARNCTPLCAYPSAKPLAQQPENEPAGRSLLQQRFFHHSRPQFQPPLPSRHGGRGQRHPCLPHREAHQPNGTSSLSCQRHPNPHLRHTHHLIAHCRLLVPVALHHCSGQPPTPWC